VVHLIVRLEIPKSNPDHLGIAAFGCGRQAALWIGETNESEPLTTHRKESGDIETGDANLSQDHYGGCLLIGHGVSGVQVA